MAVSVEGVTPLATYCHTCFVESRWFTRGWTLQELLAPSLLLFLDQNLALIGSKGELTRALHKATGIEFVYLTSSARQLRRASVACRMSWASSRKTTRIEDNAYCLLGIFGVNMTLLYGEGEKAFLRLQQQIFASTPDDSLFAWTVNDGGRIGGLFAQAPADFAHSKDIVPTPRTTHLPPHRNTSLGVELYYQKTREDDAYHISDDLLSCENITLPLACRHDEIGHHSNDDNMLAVNLFRIRFGQSTTCYRLQTSEHVTCRDMNRTRGWAQHWRVWTTPSIGKEYVSSSGDIRTDLIRLLSPTTGQYMARQYLEARKAWYKERLLCAVPILIAIYDRLFSVSGLSNDDSSSTKAAIVTWFLLTVGSRGVESKQTYFFCVAIAVVIVAFPITVALLICSLIGLAFGSDALQAWRLRRPTIDMGTDMTLDEAFKQAMKMVLSGGKVRLKREILMQANDYVDAFVTFLSKRDRWAGR